MGEEADSSFLWNDGAEGAGDRVGRPYEKEERVVRGVGVRKRVGVVRGW